MKGGGGGGGSWALAVSMKKVNKGQRFLTFVDALVNCVGGCVGEKLMADLTLEFHGACKSRL